MENKDISIENKFIIRYSNHFVFEGKILAFRKRELFDITGIPNHIKRSEKGWWIGRALLTVEKAKELIRYEPKEVDVSNLQWYEQENLSEVINLNIKE